MTPIAAVIMWGASFATIHNCPQADICVTVHNRLSASPDHYEGELSRDGFTAWLIVEMGDGDEPDHATVTVPRGYTVFPSGATIPEGESVTFEIFLPVMG